MHHKNKEEVMAVLKAFQQGYKERNIKNIDRFVEDLFLDSDDTLVVGTGNGEWCKGIKAIKELVYIDWFYWGNFKLDIENAYIVVRENYATVNTTAVLQKEYEDGKLNEININRVKNIVEADLSNQEKVYQSLKAMAYFLHEEHVGQDVKRLIRFSALIEKVGEKWQFSNIHFSYPVTPPTDVKLI